jgi:hypothetical protein
LNIKKLLRRLSKIGVDISERTLRDWAEKGVITGPKAVPRKKSKRGWPSKGSKDASEIERRKPGRLYEWPEISYEEAAAVWSIRNLSLQLGSKYKTNEAIIELRREAEYFYSTLELPDHLFSSWFWPDSSKKELGPKIKKELVAWVSAIEKARKTVRLDIPVKTVFRWLSNARPTFQGLDPARKLSTNLKSVEGDDALNCIEIFVCYAEVPVANYTAYFPGIVRVRTATEAGFQSSRHYWYYHPAKLIAELMTDEDGSECLWAFRNLDDQREFKNGIILERREGPYSFEGEF